MSFDYNVITVDPTSNAPIGACNHQQSFERYVVNSADFRTLNYASQPSINMRAPINGANNVQMWISQEQVDSDDPTYGWQIVQDRNRIATTNDIFYKIVFNHPVRIVLPLIEVSYITRQQYCLKCSALGVLNDLKQASTGLLHVVQNVKLAQKALKWILTSNCPFYPNFICLLKSYIGQKLGIQLTDTDIQTQVLTALTLMQQVQQAQGTVQSLDPAEILKDIISVNVNTDPNDPTTIYVSALCTSYTGATTPLGFTLRVNT